MKNSANLMTIFSFMFKVGLGTGEGGMRRKEKQKGRPESLAFYYLPLISIKLRNQTQ